jgi:hypothetical protein
MIYGEGMVDMTMVEGLVADDFRLKDYMKSKSLHDVEWRFQEQEHSWWMGFKGNNKNLYRGKE